MRTRILAISGSLRAVSANAAVLRAASIVAPPDIEIAIYGGLADLPHFNPDLDVDPLPTAVADLRKQIGSADALLICSPEYAHGVPGALKNALDWLVSGPEIISMPVASINASPHATHAQASLIETLSVMSTTVVRDACITLPLAGRKLDANGIARDRELSGTLRTAITALAASSATARRFVNRDA